MLIFIVPSVTAYIIYFLTDYKSKYSDMEIFVIIIGILSILFTILITFLIEETKGADFDLTYIVREINEQSRKEYTDAETEI